MMVCRECGGPMAIGEAGIICSDGCGRIVWSGSLNMLREAWPDRVIYHGKIDRQTKKRVSRIRRLDPKLPVEIPENDIGDVS